MSNEDSERREWQEAEAARNDAYDKQREREAKARERSARNARRKLERLHRTLKESGEITDFEDEFSESVAERLDRFGSAFNDREKGRPGDALSAAQKQVVARMNRKVKDAKKAARAETLGVGGGVGVGEDEDTPAYKSSFKPKTSGWKSKKGYTPNVRQLDEDFEAEDAAAEALAAEAAATTKDAVSVQALRAVEVPSDVEAKPESGRPPVGKPFLRIVE